MAPLDLADPAVRASALEYEKYVVRLKAEAKRAVNSERTGPTPILLSLSLTELASYRFPQRRPLLCRGSAEVFCGGHIGQIYAERGFGKTWLMQTLSLVAAFGVTALGFSNPEPCRVLYVDGEMAARELQERFGNLCRMLNVPPRTSGSLTIVAADWQEAGLPRLDTPEGQEAIEPLVQQADLIFLDNRSCLLDPEGEKDPSAWQPFQDYLLSLRRRGKAVMLAHHSNRQGGARGIGKAEDLMNLLIKLSRTDDYSQDQGARFLLEFTKARGVYGGAVAPFVASLNQNGWSVDQIAGGERDSVAMKLREYLSLVSSINERPKTASAAITGAKVNRNKGFEAWAAMLRRSELVQHPEGGFHLVELVNQSPEADLEM